MQQRIGRFVVGPKLYVLWNNALEQHRAIKQAPLALLFKSKSLLPGQWLQFLMDHVYIFCLLERLVSEHPELVIYKYLKRFQRSKLLINSLPQPPIELPPVSSTAKKLPSLVGSNATYLEWFSFVFFGELWFGGSVHAKVVEALLRRNTAWKELYRLQEPRLRTEMSRVTGVWDFGTFHFKVQSIQCYFQELESALQSSSTTEYQNIKLALLSAFEFANKVYSLSVYQDL